MNAPTEKLTDWFGPEISPSIPGWYERNWSSEILRKYYDYWDGKQWHFGGGAGGQTGGVAPSNLAWRGLAENPRKAQVTA